MTEMLFLELLFVMTSYEMSINSDFEILKTYTYLLEASLWHLIIATG